MMMRRLILRRAGLISGVTLLAFGGCARIQDGLDLLLSPGATANALRIPYSAVAGIAELLAGFYY